MSSVPGPEKPLDLPLAASWGHRMTCEQTGQPAGRLDNMKNTDKSFTLSNATTSTTTAELGADCRLMNGATQVQ